MPGGLLGGFGQAAAAVAVLKITADTSDANRSLGPSGLGGTLKSLIPSAGTAALAIGAIGVGVGVKLVSGFFSAAQEIDRFRKITNFSAQTLGELEIVGKKTGASLDDIADAAREMQLRLVEARDFGTGPAVDALKLLGVTLEDLENQSPEEQFERLRDALSEVDDVSQRLFLSEELLGGSSERLQGVIGLTAEEFDAVTDAARESNKVLSDETVDTLTEAAKAWQEFKDDLEGLALEGFVEGIHLTTIPGQEGFWGRVADLLLPRVPFGEQISDVFEDIVDGFTGDRSRTISFARTLLGLPAEGISDAARELEGVLQGIRTGTSSHLGLLTTIYSDVNQEIITGKNAFLVNLSEDYEETFEAIRAGTSNQLSLIGSGWQTAWDNADIEKEEFLDRLGGGWVGTFSAISAGVSTFTSLLGAGFNTGWNQIQAEKAAFLVRYAGGWREGFASVEAAQAQHLQRLAGGWREGLAAALAAQAELSRVTATGPSGGVPRPSRGPRTIGRGPRTIGGVPRFQGGGIVTSPTLALIGESGPEAVIPLGHAIRPIIVNNDFRGAIVGVTDIEETIESTVARAQRAGRLSA